MDFRAFTAMIAAAALLGNTMACSSRSARAPAAPLPPAVMDPLLEAIDKPYVELFETAARLEFSKTQIARMREHQRQSKEYCTGGFKDRTKALDSELRKSQDELQKRTKTISDADRRTLHCRIQNLQIERREAQLLAEHGIPVAYQNRLAKLDLIEQWPAQLQQIQEELRTGVYSSRKFGDVKDIGFRDVGRGQENDVKLGKETIDEMKMQGMIPPEVDNEVVREYVSEMARRIAAKSDLKVPVKVVVLNSQEVNAFALPGGFLYVQRGLIEAAEDDAQLAGVIAHEISHAAARHGHQLMRKATIASIIYQAAQVAAIIMTGGAVGLGAYYALQYGFYGLGLLLSLDILGVSRDFEREADQLGIQYTWNAGYDPSGFIRFFDLMATKEGYVNGLSWFRTHPPFYERMVDAQRELHYLPKKDNLIVRSTQFDRMKQELAKVTKRAKEDEKDKPTLLGREKDCPPPKKLDYKPGDPIEKICAPLAAASAR
ncbi:MAG: M48 family metalloprotease [Bryobacteraceae bacterium]|nr:M48 family metalloprotease [Bryobacteraceae bacterium]